MAHKYAGYKRITEILYRDIYKVLKKYGNPDSDLTVEQVLAKIAFDLCDAENTLGFYLDHVSYDKEKNKFNFEFKQG